MEVDDILADEVVDFSDAIGGPKFIEADIAVVTIVAEAGHVPNRRVHPNVKIFVGAGY